MLSEPENRFDILPLLVTTDSMLATIGYDRRRFRPNLVVGGVTGLAERQWEGGALRIGDVVIGIEQLRTRCIMTTYDPDTLKQDLNVLPACAEGVRRSARTQLLCRRSRAHQRG
jgi:uncharacterized protein YcbX